MILKNILKKMVLGNKADGGTYLDSLRKRGAKIGEGTVLFSGPAQCVIDTQNPYLLTIGKNVQLAHGVILLTHDYSWSVIKGAYGEVCGGQAPLTIGDNVFVGMNAILLAGTTIGDNVIIGAGSVVKGRIPSNVVVAGSPAKVICTLHEYRDKRRKRQLNEAVEVYRRYIERYGRSPEESLFREYFWLFRSGGDDLIPEFDEVHGLVERDVTENAFSSWEAPFSDFESFEAYCLDHIESHHGD